MLYSREEINQWDTQKSQEVMLRIFQAAKRDLSVNDGSIPEEEIKECESVMKMIEDDITEWQEKEEAKKRLFR